MVWFLIFLFILIALTVRVLFLSNENEALRAQLRAYEVEGPFHPRKRRRRRVPDYLTLVDPKKEK